MEIIVFGPISLVTVHVSLVLWLLHGGESCATGHQVFPDMNTGFPAKPTPPDRA